jgi:hypothetical protein
MESSATGIHCKSAWPRAEEGRLPPHIVDLGISLWVIYCKKASPAVRKPEVYTAAMEYLIETIVMFTELSPRLHKSTGFLPQAYLPVSAI